MMKLVLFFLIAGTVALVALGAWRWLDINAGKAAWASLASHQLSTGAVFDPAMVSGLPAPAQRFFRFAIAPGTPLYTVAEISMHGQFSLGDKAKPNDVPMRAQQILATPHGFVWKVRTGGALRFSGSDGDNAGTSWSRFWLYGIVPVARAGNNHDHARAAFGRHVAEAVFWTPAALLPGEGIRWEPVDDTTARVTVTRRGLEQAVDVFVDPDGRPGKVVFQRWSDANPGKKFQLQPFGGHLSQFRNFNGFRLPTCVEAGNWFDTDDYFPFFKAIVTSVRFPAARGTTNQPAL